MTDPVDIPPADDRPVPVGLPIRILIVDDDALVRSALVMMLASSKQMSIVAEVDDGSKVSEAVREHRPDVVLMDIRMPRMDGLTATELIVRQASPPQVIVLTTFDNDDHVWRALRAGASGFLRKDTSPPDLIRAIELVAAGDAFLSPAVTKKLLTKVSDPLSSAQHAQAQALLARLTDREREVVIAVAEGKSNAEIGSELHMSMPTVKAHMTRVLAKAQLTNRVQVALLVHRAGRF